jgi:hypothetical protein
MDGISNQIQLQKYKKAGFSIHIQLSVKNKILLDFSGTVE